MRITFAMQILALLLMTVLVNSCMLANQASPSKSDSNSPGKGEKNMAPSAAMSYWKKEEVPLGEWGNIIVFGDNGLKVIAGRGVILLSRDNGNNWKSLKGGQGDHRSTSDGGETYSNANKTDETTSTYNDVKDLCSVEGAIIAPSGRLYLRTVCEHITQIWSVPIKNEAEPWHVVSFKYKTNPSDGVYTPNTKFSLAGERILIAASMPTGSALLTTYDDGFTWPPFWRSSITGAGVVDFDFVDKDQGMLLLGDGTVSRTKDGGRSWEKISSLPGGVSQKTYSLDLADTQTGFIVGLAGLVLATSDGGLTWKTQNSGAAFNLYKVIAADSKHAWAVGDSNIVLETSDGGAHWRQVKLDIDKNIYFRLSVNNKAAWVVLDQFMFHSS